MPDRNDTLTAQCRDCKKTFELKVNIADVKAWRQGTLIQKALPYLTPDERELLISGICGGCFDRAFGEPDVEEDEEDEDPDPEPRYYHGPSVQEQQVANQQLKR